ncbi:hypothetical protein GCM10022251_25050 [Phytohabitans flavus]|uniref:Protease PrsW n=2 Tax=Phytohabitans flavus TaxID=1076124 RepID=A0A6F8XRC0_9ACTN|nr:hypothetical protein Pflav_027010 [Phytohabitans flavus]
MTSLVEPAPYPAAYPQAAVRHRRHMPSWLKLFLVGAALWAATVLITFATLNVNLVPTVILLGSFLVPVTFVAFAFARADGVLTPQRIFTAFVVGGVLGVLGASVLESALLRQPSGLGFVGVGLIEEAVKLGALWLLSRHLTRYTVRDGMVLGASVGFGFAALESAGYAFTSLFTPSGLSLLNVVETEALRGALAPVGHGLWTAILGGVLFATAARARNGRPRPRGSVFGWFLVVSALHAMWDAAGIVAVWLTLLLTGTASQLRMIELGQAPGVTQTQVHLYTILNWSLLAADAAVGVVLLWLRWRRQATARVAHAR